MTIQSGKAHKFSRLLRDVYALRAEIQILLCMALWVIIALCVRAFYLFDEARTLIMAWAVLLLVFNGLLFGPIVAMTTAAIVAIFMGLHGYALASGAIGEVAQLAVVMLCAAGVGGGLKRVLEEIQRRLYLAENRVDGTNLPNYKAAVDHLKALVKPALSNSKQLEVLRVQLHNIEQLRKQIGRERSDQLVSEFAALLKDKLGSDAHISQTSDSELLGLLPLSEGLAQQIDSILKAALKEAAKRNDGTTPNLEPSCTLQRHTLSPEEVDAGQWLNKVIKRAVDSYGIHAAEPASTSSDSTQAELDRSHFIGASISCRKIQRGLQRGEFEIEYLPRLNVNSGYFSALEAIIVWRHPQRGDLRVSDFVTMLDDSAAILNFSLWAMDRLLHDVDEWLALDHRVLISVNLSLNDQIQTELLEKILIQMRQRPTNTGWLALEFSEKALSRADPSAVNALQNIQQYGGAVIVSSYLGSTIALSQVFQLPVDTVKLSPTFLDNALSHSDRRRELGSLIDMIHSRGLTVIADGIEGGAAIRMLRPYGCDELTGPFLSRSMDKANIPWGRIKV